jgi:Fic family protein
LAQQARESYERTLELHDLQERYEETYGDSTRADGRLAMKLFERPYLTTNDVGELLDVSGPTAYRAIDSLEEDGVLEEITGKESHREYRARELFEILERPPTACD